MRFHGSRVRVALALAALLLAQTLPAALQFDMFVGFNGVLRQNAWTPVMFDVRNDGPPFVGTIELVTDATRGGTVRRTVVELPTGSLKRVFLPVISSARYGQNWRARLLNEGGRLVAECRPMGQASSTPVVHWGSRLMVALARAPKGVPDFPKVGRSTGGQDIRQPVCTYLQPPLLPDNPLLLEGVDAIYLNSEKVTELRETHVRTLLAWLYSGGHLIVGIEQAGDLSAATWLRALLPVALEAPGNLNEHLQFQEWAKGGNRDDAEFPALSAFNALAADAVFEAAPMQVWSGQARNGRVVVGSDALPLVVSGARERGRVTALLFSPEREPFVSWKNAPQFWARLVGVPGAIFTEGDNTYYNEVATDGVFGAMVDSRQIRKMPVGWLLVLLVVYLVVIGPFDRWWLKRINRPMLTWITFPGYVVLFSLLIYYIGYRLRAGETEWNECHVVDVFTRGERAELRGRAYGSVYSPANQRYLFTNAAPVASFRAESAGVYGMDDLEARVLQRGDAASADVYVPVWINKLCVSDWWGPGPLPFQVSVRRAGGDTLEVTVDNHLDCALADLRLAVGERLFALERVGPRERKTATLSARSGQNLSEVVQQTAGNFAHIVQSRRGALAMGGTGAIQDRFAAALAACFLSEARQSGPGGPRFSGPPGLDLAPLLDHQQAVLLAWTPDRAPIPPLNQFNPRRSQRYTLWRMSCAVQE